MYACEYEFEKTYTILEYMKVFFFASFTFFLFEYVLLY
jgi:hypothetical protein